VVVRRTARSGYSPDGHAHHLTRDHGPTISPAFCGVFCRLLLEQFGTHMNKKIDLILEQFIREMARISALNETEEQKERHAKTWLRTTLEKFEQELLSEERQ
jgi:hypothetical protein